MATITLLAKLDGGGSPFPSNGGLQITGTADYGDAVRAQDAKNIFASVAGGTEAGVEGYLFDTTGLPAAAVISSVVFSIRHKITTGVPSRACYPGIEWTDTLYSDRHALTFDAPHAGGELTNTSYESWTVTKTTNPATSAAWTVADFASYGMAIDRALYIFGPNTCVSYEVDYISALVTYTIPWWKLVLPTMTLYFSGAQPSTYTLTFDIWSNGVFYPSGTTFTWVSTSDPGDTGWWMTLDAFAGAVYVVQPTSRPITPRGFTEV